MPASILFYMDIITGMTIIIIMDVIIRINMACGVAVLEAGEETWLILWDRD